MSEPRSRAREYVHLPERVPPEQLRETQPASDPPEPDLGRDPDHDWLLRGV